MDCNKQVFGVSTNILSLLLFYSCPSASAGHFSRTQAIRLLAARPNLDSAIALRRRCPIIDYFFLPSAGSSASRARIALATRLNYLRSGPLGRRRRARRFHSIESAAVENFAMHKSYFVSAYLRATIKCDISSNSINIHLVRQSITIGK